MTFGDIRNFTEECDLVDFVKGFEEEKDIDMNQITIVHLFKSFVTSDEPDDGIDLYYLHDSGEKVSIDLFELKDDEGEEIVDDDEEDDEDDDAARALALKRRRSLKREVDDEEELSDDAVEKVPTPDRVVPKENVLSGESEDMFEPDETVPPIQGLEKMYDENGVFINPNLDLDAAMDLRNDVVRSRFDAIGRRHCKGHDFGDFDGDIPRLLKIGDGKDVGKKRRLGEVHGIKKKVHRAFKKARKEFNFGEDGNEKLKKLEGKVLGIFMKD